jgi:hypothetical protein
MAEKGKKVFGTGPQQSLKQKQARIILAETTSSLIR